MREERQGWTVENRTDLLKNLHRIAIEEEWGSENQIEAENKFFEFAKLFGWDCDEDDQFQGLTNKATTKEVFEFAVEALSCCGIIDHYTLKY